MKRPSPLTLLIDLRRRDRDRVASIAAQAQREADTAAGTLRMLADYRSDYESRSPKTGQAATDMGRVRIHEAFVAKLGYAIGEQKTMVAHLMERNDHQRAVLTERQQQLKALETLAERRIAEQRKRMNSIEQKQTDEFATQAYARIRRNETAS